MDEQVCSLDLASYAFTTDDIVYRWYVPNPIQFHPMLNTSLPCFTVDKAYTDTCTSITTTGEYSCIRMVFHLKRLFSYYMAQIYIPSSLLVIVSWVSFWLERTAVPARVTLGVTTLLTMTTQAASINNSLPAVSYVKAVDVWIGVCLAFIFAAVLEFAWVSYRGSLQSECPFHSRKTATAEAIVRKRMSKKDSWGTAKQEETVPFGDIDDPLGSTEGLLTFWQKWKLNADPPKMIDLKSRVIFPLLFLIFNIVYWIWCAVR
ncbi:Neurotransmitter-gated ion-channel transmembrane region [Ancylostoma caninum]|uniref:Neurotransmitter-gated ion-channel transmembrane region n=1 Tax=Ancylostoma caninum TaxID=29170 RepID=A0A368G3U9_ANCCA|nr:Neurotransmitter-gated ion-channel transmembrane region [Ancylostoma caninum]